MGTRRSFIILFCLLVSAPSLTEAARRQYLSISGTAWLCTVKGPLKAFFGKEEMELGTRLEFFPNGHFVERNLETGDIRILGTWRQVKAKVIVTIDAVIRQFLGDSYERLYHDVRGTNGSLEFRKWIRIFKLKQPRNGDPFLISKEAMKALLFEGKQKASVAWKLKGGATFNGSTVDPAPTPVDPAPTPVDPAVIDALLEVTESDAKELLDLWLSAVLSRTDAFGLRCCPFRWNRSICCDEASNTALLFLQDNEDLAAFYYKSLVLCLARRWDPAIVDLDTFVSLGITYVIKLRDRAIHLQPEFARDHWHTFMTRYVYLLPHSLQAAINAR